MDGLLDTGDLGVLRDGRLRVTGRADQMIISGGENVYPQELENALFALPEVADAVAVGVPDEDFGARLVAMSCSVRMPSWPPPRSSTGCAGRWRATSFPGGAGRCAPSFGERVRQAEPSCLPGCSALRASPGGGVRGRGVGPGRGWLPGPACRALGGCPQLTLPGQPDLPNAKEDEQERRYDTHS